MGKGGEKKQADVLAVLRQRREPVSAYDVLADLRLAHPRIAPTRIYRALSALTERGKVHRLESLNAFVACQCGGHQQASVLSICGSCSLVEESIKPDALEELGQVVRVTGFEPQRHVIEAHGLCSDCHADQAPV